LINVRLSELLSNPNNSIPLGILIGISFNYPVYEILPNFNNNDWNITLGHIFYNDYSNNLIELLTLTNTKLNNDKIAFATSKVWDGYLAETSHITSIGNIMYSSYSIWLILTSIILLLAMVGAIVITIKQKTK
jgi:NADH-ubiquinone oxidoreductase chain 6